MRIFKLRWKLKEKLVVFAMLCGIVPLIIAIAYSGQTTTKLLKGQVYEYLQSKIESFEEKVLAQYSTLASGLSGISDESMRKKLSENIKNHLSEEGAKVKYFQTGYLVIFESDGRVAYHPNPEYKNNTTLYDSSQIIRDAVNKKQGYYEYRFDGQDMISYLDYIEELDWIIWGVVPAIEVFAQIKAYKLKMYIFLVLVGLIVGIVGFLFARRLAKSAEEISEKMIDIAQGDADLSVRLPVITKDEIGDIAHWFNIFVENLEDVISKVKVAAINVDVATREVSSGSQGLSQTTQEQAASIEEVVATIEQMTTSIKQNASNASESREKAVTMVQLGNKSGEDAQELMQGMEKISNASKKIGNIIVTVNEVAFQTNLLALNAAVEAARAGEHGKGFAVVAEEVRSLAQRSAEAAKQIKDLIEDTVEKIDAGDEMVKRSGKSLEQIISHIEELSQAMESIASASVEQANGVDELKRALSQIDNTTQTNASTVEELASTSENLSTEAKDLADSVKRFRVSTNIE